MYHSSVLVQLGGLKRTRTLIEVNPKTQAPDGQKIENCLALNRQETTDVFLEIFNRGCPKVHPLEKPIVIYPLALEMIKYLPGCENRCSDGIYQSEILDLIHATRATNSHKTGFGVFLFNLCRIEDTPATKMQTMHRWNFQTRQAILLTFELVYNYT